MKAFDWFDDTLWFISWPVSRSQIAPTWSLHKLGSKPATISNGLPGTSLGGDSMPFNLCVIECKGGLVFDESDNSIAFNSRMPHNAGDYQHFNERKALSFQYFYYPLSPDL